MRWPEAAENDRDPWSTPQTQSRRPAPAPGFRADRPDDLPWNPAGRAPGRTNPPGPPAAETSQPRAEQSGSRWTDTPAPGGQTPTGPDYNYDPGYDHNYDATPAYGRPAWVAVLAMVAITAVGVAIDVIRDATGGVNIAIIVGALIAIVIVRRPAMFPVVIAPPLVYILGSAAVLYLRSGGPHNRTVLIDIATNWLVYGFPAMAAATAVVLVVAGVRMALRR